MVAPRINTRTAPTQRALARLRASGWLCDIAERRTGPISRDLFGCIDIVAVHPVERRFLFLQVTGDNGGNFAARFAKVQASSDAAQLVRAGAEVEVWAWKAERAEPRVGRLAGVAP